ncbi:NAD(P)H-binding protein [Xanthomonas massiliensis]|uniref:NAD(P)H-binding protein n=1 Tax=Xanthomonas massiliensis TaxID=1720302 RepID=UPI0008263B79|nr:NAD(P)H-binding protein [Xanthomonas massiliensis]
MKVMLLGATGLVGSHVLRQLLDDPRCTQVVAPVRHALAQAEAKLLAPVVDFEALPAEAAWWAVDAVVCALGTTRAKAGSRAAFRHVDHDYPLACAQIALRHGARIFALNSAKGADTQSRFFYSRVKGELERDLCLLGFPSLTLVRPGLIGGERHERRRAERAAAALLRALGPLLPRGLRIDPAAHVAAALVQAVLAPRDGVHVVDAAQLAG